MSPNLARIHGALSSVRHEMTFDNAAQCPPLLIDALQQGLPHIAPNSWAARFDYGGIYVNGRIAHRDMSLSPPCRIEYYEPKFPIERAHEYYPSFDTKLILYQDNDLLVAYKPRGLPTTRSREQNQFHFRMYLENFVQRNVHLPSRLDTSTQGVIVVSTSTRMNSRLQRMYERHLVDKRYLLQVPGTLDWDEQRVDAPIGRDPTHPVLRKVDRTNGNSALTYFRKRGYAKLLPPSGESIPTTILEARPITGKTHQIRVHISSLGLSVIGDNFYGGLPAAELHLLSFQVSLWHPFQHRRFTCAAPASLCPPWAQNFHSISES